MKIEIDVDEEKLINQVKKAGKVDQYTINIMVEKQIEKEIAKLFKKHKPDNLSKLLDSVIEEIDWNEKVKNWLRNQLEQDYY